jgi:hypothetical protein
MKHAQLIDRLHALAEDSGPGPDPAFMARLGAELHQMEQVPVLSERPARHHGRPGRLGRLTWVRFVSVAVPAGAIALAGAFVALRPEPARPHQVRTADPGVSTPAPDIVQPAPSEPGATAPTVTRPPVTTGPGATTGVVPSHATVTTAPPTRHLTVPSPFGQSPETTVAPSAGSRPEPATTTTTTAAPPPASPQSLSLHCSAGAPSTTPAVSCTWSASTSSAFRSYRLSKEKPGTNRAVVFTTDNRDSTGYVDHDVQAGAGYGYWIEALDASGTVIGRGSATVSCC